jgi:hypothetical protein
MADSQKIRDSNNGKANTCRMSGFGKNEETELEHDSYY